jgi:protein associated with RNAse G/E
LLHKTPGGTECGIVTTIFIKSKIPNAKIKDTWYTTRNTQKLYQRTFRKEEPMVQLFRKRYIPNETVHLKDDEIVFQSEEMIITKWKTLKPRADISYGISAYFVNDGYKVSKMFNSSNQVVYWYCDIINTVKDADHESIIFEDLLVDVLVYENGLVKVLDLAELAEAFDMNLIAAETVSTALRSLDKLLEIIYTNQFPILQEYINQEFIN